MDNAYKISSVLPPSSQNRDSEEKSFDKTSAFHDALGKMMQEHNTAFSVKQVNVEEEKRYEEELFFPNRNNLKELISRLRILLDLFFARNGISAKIPVEIRYLYSKSEIMVTGERDDTEEISRLINRDTVLLNHTRITLAMAGLVINMAESLSFQREYRESDNQEEVLEKYGFLFDQCRHAHTPAVRYDGSLTLLSDGNSYSL